MPRGRGGLPLQPLETDSFTVYSARWLDWDTLSQRLPYRIAPYVVRQAPGAGVPEKPARSLPRPADEMMHLSYAVQWFFFGAVLLFGSLILARVRRPAAPHDIESEGTAR